MSTPALIHVLEKEGDKVPLLTIYQQFEGHPTSLGAKIKKYFSKTKIVEIFRVNMRAGDYANGMGCFAAQLVRCLKANPLPDLMEGDAVMGNVHIVPPGTEDDEIYVYIHHAH